jgi:hypothetical protein
VRLAVLVLVAVVLAEVKVVDRVTLEVGFALMEVVVLKAVVELTAVEVGLGV